MKKKKQNKPGKPAEKKDKLEIETKWIFFICIAAVAIFFIIYFLHDSLGTIKWNEHVFHRAKVGQDNGWEANISLINGGLFLRNSPLELEKIPANISGGIYNNAIIVLTPEISNCSNKRIAPIILVQFLSYFGVKVNAALNETTNIDPNYFAGLDTNKSCMDAIKKTVFFLKKSENNETKIYRDKMYKDCIIIEYEDCDVMKGVEAFIIHEIAIIEENQKKIAEKNNSTNNSLQNISSTANSSN